MGEEINNGCLEATRVCIDAGFIEAPFKMKQDYKYFNFGNYGIKKGAIIDKNGGLYIFVEGTKSIGL